MTSALSLDLWAGDQKVAVISHVPLDDTWALAYTAGWQAAPHAFGLSPALPLRTPAEGYRSASVRRFLENLLPEGRALDTVAASRAVAKTNIYGLIRALGTETTGALRFLAPGDEGHMPPAQPARQISLAELDERIAQRAERPFSEWDGKVRMSIAGYQDKLPVYLEGEPSQGGRIMLPDWPLASTHLLKPQPDEPGVPYMVVNEHFCMSLARALAFPVAEVALLRTPRPVLVVTRFDRVVRHRPEGVQVERKHIIDVCQATDLPVSYKYERHLGSGEVLAQYRDGVGFPTLFEQLQHVTRKATGKLAMLRWALFQLVIGNCDAHGKNFSFHVQPAGLEPAPWYDLVSVVQYPKFSHELAMAYGDEFKLEQVKAFALADFSQRCGIDRQLLVRESKRLRDGVAAHAKTLAQSAPYDDDERRFAQQIADYATAQAARLHEAAREAARISSEYL